MRVLYIRGCFTVVLAENNTKRHVQRLLNAVMSTTTGWRTQTLHKSVTRVAYRTHMRTHEKAHGASTGLHTHTNRVGALRSTSPQPPSPLSPRHPQPPLRSV